MKARGVCRTQIHSLTSYFSRFSAPILLIALCGRALFAEEIDPTDRVILELLLSKSDLVVQGQVLSKPTPWSDSIPGRSNFVLLRFLPRFVLKGKLRAATQLEVAIPVNQDLDFPYAKGREYILFLTSPASNHLLHWRTVSKRFAVQPYDLKLQRTLLQLVKAKSELLSDLTANLVPAATQQPKYLQIPPSRWFPGNDPSEIGEYRDRIETMQRSGQWRSLPTLRPSKVERLMESGGSR